MNKFTKANFNVEINLGDPNDETTWLDASDAKLLELHLARALSNFKFFGIAYSSLSVALDFTD